MRRVRIASLVTIAAAAVVGAPASVAGHGHAVAPPVAAQATAELEGALEAVGARHRSPARPLGSAQSARGFELVPGLGPARRLPSGTYLLRARDGELSMTHGPDAVAMPGALHQLPGGLGDTPYCVTTGPDANSVVVLYGRHASSPYRRDEFYPTINNALWRMNEAVRTAALNSGGPAAQIRTPCYHDGVSVRLPAFVNYGANTFADIRQAAVNAGFCTGQSHCYGSGARKYLIFYDHGDLPGGAAGIAECYCQDHIGAWNRRSDNWNNTTSMYAVVWRGRTDNQAGYWHTQVTLHELFHTLGAVNVTAPHATRGFHCADGIDVMCYDDGGMYSGQYYHEGTCTSTNPVAIDCRQDAYFDTRSEPNTWISWYWQLGWSGNKFFAFDGPAG